MDDKIRLRHVIIEVLIFEVLYTALGIGIGTITSSYQLPVNASTDVARYQNLGIAIGALVGFFSCISAALIYLVVVKKLNKTILFSKRLLLVEGTLTGTIVSLVTYTLINIFSTSFGMVARTSIITVLDGITVVFIGTGSGFILTELVYKVRGYE